MDAHEVVVRGIEAHHRHVVCYLLAKGVGEAGKAAHPHTHVEVLSLDVRGGNIGFDGLASDWAFVDADALGRRVANLAGMARLTTVYLDQLGKIHIDAKGIVCGF